MTEPTSAQELFKGRHFDQEIIVLCVRWYLTFKLSSRDLVQMMAKRGITLTHTTISSYGGCSVTCRNLRSAGAGTRGRSATRGEWMRLTSNQRPVGLPVSRATIDFLLSAKRDAAAAERFLAKALRGENHPAPRVINTDEHAGYPPAIVRLKAEETLDENCRHRPVQYLNNVLEQDHRAIKRRVRAAQNFRSFWGAWRTIAGYEAIHMIRKGQACWSAVGAKVGLLHRFILGLFAATN